MNNIAIIPVRMGSRRLPRKNVLDFYGKPLFVHTLEHAQRSGLFSEIFVSTESEEVRELCANRNLNLPFLRPSELAKGESSLTSVCIHALDEFEQRGKKFDNVCLLWATSPMRTDKDIIAAYFMLDDKCDAVVAVSEYNLPPFCAMRMAEDHMLKPMFPDLLMLPGEQVPSLVCDTGAMCWIKADALRKYKTWLPPKIKGYMMPREHSVDLDTKDDLKLLHTLYKEYIKSTNRATQ